MRNVRYGLRCPDRAELSEDYTEYATAIEAAVLSGYQKNQPHKSTRSSNFTRDGLIGEYYGSEAGTDVRLEVRFFKIDEVNIAKGIMRLNVWFRLSWTDERLAWQPSDHGGVSFINLASPESEEIDIWVPDIKIYNGRDDVTHTLSRSGANINSYVVVYWSRPGALDVLCKFSGLVAFPYDKLRCTFELGGWVWSGSYQVPRSQLSAHGLA